MTQHSNAAWPKGWFGREEALDKVFGGAWRQDLREALQQADDRKLRALREMLGPGDVDTGAKHAHLDAVFTAPGVFQWRLDDDEPWKKEAHVKDLAAQIRNGAKVPPLDVWPVGGLLVVLEGHHRMEALRKARRVRVPIRVLPDLSLDEAMVHAYDANARSKLPYTRSEKAEASWRWHRNVYLGMDEEERAQWPERRTAQRFAWDKTLIRRQRRALLKREWYEHDELLDFDPQKVERWSEVRWRAKQQLNGDDFDFARYRAGKIDLLIRYFGHDDGKIPDKLAQLLVEALPNTVEYLIREGAHETGCECSGLCDEMCECDGECTAFCACDCEDR